MTSIDGFLIHGSTMANASNSSVTMYLFSSSSLGSPHDSSYNSGPDVTQQDQDLVSVSGAAKAAKDGEDFGAVMYITAVLVFYSLGIVVMIIKYLKTEHKEMEEEMMLENFFKGIPSKRIEHEREAVNRVAIRAFHTLTAGATRHGEFLPPAGSTPFPVISERNSNPDDSDVSSSNSSVKTESPYGSSKLQRERSKYLPRVSLMFRDNRPALERRRFHDSFRSQAGRFVPEVALPGDEEESRRRLDSVRSLTSRSFHCASTQPHSNTVDRRRHKTAAPYNEERLQETSSASGFSSVLEIQNSPASVRSQQRESKVESASDCLDERETWRHYDESETRNNVLVCGIPKTNYIGRTTSVDGSAKTCLVVAGRTQFRDGLWNCASSTGSPSKAVLQRDGQQYHTVLVSLPNEMVHISRRLLVSDV